MVNATRLYNTLAPFEADLTRRATVCWFDASMRLRKKDTRERDGLTMAWGTVTTVLGMIALASLGTLVVTTSVKDIDALSTIALALAVLSFSAQLIVTLAQSFQTSQVNSDTRGALADMRATTSSLLTNQRDQFNKVLEAALRQAIPAAVHDVETDHAEGESGEDSSIRTSELEEALRTRIDEALQDQRRTEEHRNRRDRERRERRIEVNRKLQNYPSREEGEPVLEKVKQLSPKAITALSRLASDVRDSPFKDESVAYGGASDTPSPGLDALEEAGFVEMLRESSPNKDGRVMRHYKLTPEGWIAARILRGTGPVPEWARDLV